MRRAGLEQFFQLGILKDRAHGFNEAEPVRSFQKLGDSRLMQLSFNLPRGFSRR
jgi:hypothetical protein